MTAGAEEAVGWRAPGGLVLGMVRVPAGSFLLGHDLPRYLARDGGPDDHEPAHLRWMGEFLVARTPVTVAQYRAYCDSTGEDFPPAPPWGWDDAHPVVNVTWQEAAAFCAWAGLELPSEAEWERAAKGEADVAYPWGEGRPYQGGLVYHPEMDRLDEDDYRAFVEEPGQRARAEARNYLCVYADHPVYGGRSTAPAGSCPGDRSPWGALDMAGNVSEWCADWFQPRAYETPDEPPVGGTERVVRGGAWISPRLDFSVYHRRHARPGAREPWLGFRPIHRVGPPPTRPRSIAVAQIIPGEVQAAHQGPHGLFLVFRDGSLGRWADGHLDTVRMLDPDGIRSASFSADGRRLICVNNRCGLFVETTRGAARIFEHRADRQPEAAVIDLGGRAHWVQGSALWRADGQEAVRVAFLGSNHLECLAISLDGGTLAVGQRTGMLYLLGLDAPEEGARSRPDGGSTLRDVAFSPDGGLVLSACTDGKVSVWDVATAERLRRFEGHRKEPWGVAFLPDGVRAASGGHDKSVRIWDVASCEEVAMAVLPTAVDRLVALPDGRLIASTRTESYVLEP